MGRPVVQVSGNSGSVTVTGQSNANVTVGNQAADVTVGPGASKLVSDSDFLKLCVVGFDDGVYEGFPSAYREVVGGVFPSSVTWYTAPDKTQKIVEKLIVRNGNQLPTTVTHRLYHSGVLALTAVDTIIYSGVLETSRSRVVS